MLPRELPEINPNDIRPVTKQEALKPKKLASLDSSLVDDRMNKITTTLNKLNLQLEKFQSELETRQKDPLVIDGDYMMTNSSQ